MSLPIAFFNPQLASGGSSTSPEPAHFVVGGPPAPSTVPDAVTPALQAPTPFGPINYNPTTNLIQPAVPSDGSGGGTSIYIILGLVAVAIIAIFLVGR